MQLIERTAAISAKPLMP